MAEAAADSFELVEWMSAECGPWAGLAVTTTRWCFLKERQAIS
jgi:hypothetical protein